MMSLRMQLTRWVNCVGALLMVAGLAAWLLVGWRPDAATLLLAGLGFVLVQLLAQALATRLERGPVREVLIATWLREVAAGQNEAPCDRAITPRPSVPHED